MVGSGALDAVEQLIASQSARALDAVADLEGPAVDVLRRLVVAATSRTG
jgi:hypothetical protein